MTVETPTTGLEGFGLSYLVFPSTEPRDGSAPALAAEALVLCLRHSSTGDVLSSPAKAPSSLSSPSGGGDLPEHKLFGEEGQFGGEGRSVPICTSLGNSSKVGSGRGGG